jgi:hypothetical protein
MKKLPRRKPSLADQIKALQRRVRALEKQFGSIGARFR